MRQTLTVIQNGVDLFSRTSWRMWILRSSTSSSSHRCWTKQIRDASKRSMISPSHLIPEHSTKESQLNQPPNSYHVSYPPSHSCDCLGMLLQECNKLGLLSDSNTACLTSKRYTTPSPGFHCCALYHFDCGWHLWFIILTRYTITPLKPPTPPPPSNPTLSVSLLCPTTPPTPTPFPLQIWFRTEDREFAPRLKTAENANIQPNPGLILRAEPTVTNILKVKP